MYRTIKLISRRIWFDLMRAQCFCLACESRRASSVVLRELRRRGLDLYRGFLSVDGESLSLHRPAGALCVSVADLEFQLDIWLVISFLSKQEEIKAPCYSL